jgi:hypothetical protein
MNDFTASNGMTLTQSPEGHIILPKSIMGLGPETQQALREFFWDEEDKSLGRWRSAIAPHITVWIAPDQDGDFVAIDQVTRDRFWFSRDGDTSWSFKESSDASLIERVQVEFFDAHPEPKPWHDAKPGEVWEIVTAGGEIAAYIVESTGNRFLHVERRLLALNLDDAGIVSCRLIWSGVQS